MTIKDMPDNYPWLPNDARYPMGDMGEAAVRLGSPNIYDRRGSVLWMDDFSHGLSSVTTGGDDATSIQKITTTNVYHGGYDLLLGAGSGGAKYAYFWKFFTHTKLEKLGIEIGVAYIDGFSCILISLARLITATAYTSRIKLNYADDLIEYMDDEGDYQPIAVLDPMIGAERHFNVMKLVVDFSEAEYVRLQYNNHIYDLSGIAIEADSNGFDQQQYFDFNVYGTGAGVQKVQVSHAILTAGEN